MRFWLALLFSFTATAAENPILLKRAEAGNIIAIKRAFVLAAASDGATAEDMNAAIGKSIPLHAKNFLIALKDERKKVKRLDAVLGHLDAGYLDDLSKQKLELEKRLAAIDAVKDDALKQVREECEALLKHQIAERK